MPHQVNHYDPHPLSERGSLAALPEYVQKKTSWNGLEKLIPQIIQDFNISPDFCIEFGVWHGYSTAALANNFKRVIGADVFYGDVIPGTEGTPMIETTRKSLAPWGNIELRECAMEDFDYTGLPVADLIHVDASHNYKDWFGVMKAVAHGRVVIFHDTGNWFLDVPRLVYEVAERFGLQHYHYPHCEGLDILDCRPLLDAADHVEIRHFVKQGYPIEGVVHVGANDGYEIPYYLRLGAKKVIAFEPLKSACEQIISDPRVEVHNLALGEANTFKMFNITEGDGKGSSFLEEFIPYPVVDRRAVDIARFDSLDIDISECNTLVVDVQGFEMQVLKGFSSHLGQFEFLNIECSRVPLYAGEFPAQAVIDYLAEQGFQQETPILDHGDIMFRRKPKRVIPGWNYGDRMLPLLEPHHYVEPPGPLVLGIASGRHWDEGEKSWEHCIRSWDRNALYRQPRYHVFAKPMMEAYNEIYRNTRQEIIGYMHDDLEILENNWDTRVLNQFADPQVGLVGFFGGLGHCQPYLYDEPCKGQNFVRFGVRSNMVDAEVHGERFAGECDVVVLDGLALFVRRRILDKMGGWPIGTPVSYWCYDYLLGCEARRQGYKIRLVGVACQHHASKSPSIIAENWDAAHEWLYNNYRDVLPARVG